MTLLTGHLLIRELEGLILYMSCRDGCVRVCGGIGRGKAHPNIMDQAGLNIKVFGQVPLQFDLPECKIYLPET